MEALEELRSDFGGLGGFWGQSCQSRNVNNTLLFVIFVLIPAFRSSLVRILYRMIAPDNVNLSSDFGSWNCYYFMGFELFCEMPDFVAATFLCLFL